MRAVCVVLSAVPLAALLLAGCEDTIPETVTDLPLVQDMSGGPDFAAIDQAAPLEFADFVIGLINTATADTTSPTTTEDKAFVDSMDPAKFSALFP